VHRDARPCVALDHKRITLTVRPGSNATKRADVIHEWHKGLLHKTVPPIIQRWERKLGVEVRGYFLQRMKTKWGSCNHGLGHIRLNTELVKKPKDTGRSRMLRLLSIWSSRRDEPHLFELKPDR
jgi:predicted metal-dependent hydrolase